MLALYTFKQHGASTEGTTVSTAGHDVDTRSSISRPMAKGATLPPRSMTSRVLNVQASVSRDAHGVNADVAYVNKLTVKEMEEELKLNAQHHSGTKSILRERMIDGLMHGPLVASCLICRKGRLKICEENPNLLRCKGYFDTHTVHVVMLHVVIAQMQPKPPEGP
jgi:hypothetical protein